MTDQDIANALQLLKEDFIPVYPSASAPSAEQRGVAAAEYAAYHLGQIDKKLDQVIGLLTRLAQNP